MRSSFAALVAAACLLSACATGSTNAVAPGGTPVAVKVSQEPVALTFDGRRSLVTVQTHINGQGPFMFLVDTGAEHMVLSADVAQRIGISGSQPATAYTPGGERRGRIASIDTLDIGATRIRGPLPAMIVDTKADDPSLPIDGIVGNSVLSLFRTTIDLPQRKLSFALPDTSVAPAPSTARRARGVVGYAPLRSKRRLILIDTKINDNGPYRFMLDTGANLTTLSTELASKLDIKPHERVQEARDVGGKHTMKTATVASASVAGYRFAGPRPVGIMESSATRKALDGELDGLIGLDMLRHFRITIDPHARTVTLEHVALARATAPTAPADASPTLPVTVPVPAD